MTVKRVLTFIICISLILTSLCAVVTAAGDEKLLSASEVQANVQKWGYINQQGTFVIKPEYVSASDFNEKDIAIVAKGSTNYDVCSVCFIDKAGKTVSGPYKAYIPAFENGIAVLNGDTNTSWAVDSSGKLLFESREKLYGYSSEVIAFSKETSENNILYGLKDLTGKVVVPATYRNLDEYSGKFGKSTGPVPYFDEKAKKYGYKAQDGSIVIKPMFNSVEKFEDGFAVVNIETKQYIYSYALINIKGEYIIKPEYTGIKSLGQGLYAISKGTDVFSSDWHCPKAVFNNEGKQLTDYKYYSVSAFEGDYAAACDDTTTFFIDKKGNMVNDLPRLKGIGIMVLQGEVVKAALDGGLQYLAKDGRVIWQKDEAVSLGNGLIVRPVKYRTNYLTFVEYPSLDGLGNKTVQESINKKLKETFTAGYETKNTSDKVDDDYAARDEVNFSVQRNQNLLIVERSGYFYPIGAAHGQPSRYYYYIDLQTGTFYEMKDLFKSGSKYIEKLTSLVKQKLALNNRIYNVLGDENHYLSEPSVYDKQCYLIGKDSIKFIYQPYEIAAYALGFPEIEITYGQMADIINTNGSFWKSFDKKVVKNKISILSNDYDAISINEGLVGSFANLISSYENKIIDAINTNNFAKVEQYLTKGSSLYNSQAKLVKDLYKKKTIEKLVSYDIYAVCYDYVKKEYKIFVSETISIKYTGKAYVNKKYDWCYTAKQDNTSKSYKLSNIEKW